MQIHPQQKTLNTRHTLSITLLPFLLVHSVNVLAIDSPTNIVADVNSTSEITWQWQAVDDAAQYAITVDGLYWGNTSATSLTIDGLWAGEHSMSVKAIDQNGEVSTASTDVKVNTATSSVNENTSIVSRTAEDQSSNPIDVATYSYGGEYEKPGYELTFSDEFNGQELNSAKWNTQLRWDGEFNGERFEYRVINGENQFYVNTLSNDQEHLNSVVPAYNPFEFNGESLAIRAIKNPLKTTNNTASYGPLSTIVAQQEFLSGAIATYDKFTQKYGYFEARIKIPSHAGTFPAFWLHHQRQANEDTRKTEIDIMENLGHAPWYIYNSFHYYENVSETYGGDAQSVKPQPEGQIYNGTDFSLDYHTYAVEWEPGYIAWFIDGQKVSEVSNENVDHEELYVILNLAMGGYWTNYPANSGGLGRDYENFFPNIDDLNSFSNPALEIDYVRVYKKQ